MAVTFVGRNNRSYEAQDFVVIGKDSTPFDVMGVGIVDAATNTVEWAWERVVGYLFTASGRPLISASGRMLCLKHQLDK